MLYTVQQNVLGLLPQRPENAFHAFLDQFWTFVAVLILVPRRQGDNLKFITPEF